MDDASFQSFLQKYLDADMKDAIRALRPGGPLDTTLLQTRCLQCELEINRPVRWFLERDFACSCGGEFDRKPLQGAVQNMITARHVAPESPDTENLAD